MIFLERQRKRKIVQLEICTKYLKEAQSNMAILEIPILSGFKLDLESVENLIRSGPNNLKRYERQRLITRSVF